MRWIVVALAMTVSQPALACHRFSVWKYPWPQRCSVVHPQVAANAWAVEITTPPPLAVIEDQRTPEQIAEYLEHERAVAAYKNELNLRLRLLELEKQK